jgi:hypothetical protein
MKTNRREFIVGGLAAAVGVAASLFPVSTCGRFRTGNEIIEYANTRLAPLVAALESLRVQYTEEEDGMPLYDCQGAMEDVLAEYRKLKEGK